MPDDLADVIIVGAGPAGVGCALGLAGSGLKVLLIDKDQFPREKVCGGGLWLRSVRVLNDLLPNVGSNLQAFSNKTSLCGISVCTPEGSNFVYKSTLQGDERKTLGYTVNRDDFDQWMVDQAIKAPEVSFLPQTHVNQVLPQDETIKVIGDGFEYHSKMVVMADGVQALASGDLSGMQFNRHEDALAIRAYFKNVAFDTSDNILEFCFLKDVYPGYLWIFPLQDKIVNVGVYLPLKYLGTHKANLKNLLYELIQENSSLACRFQDATLVGRIRGGLLPLGKTKITLSGNRFLVAGDAASLVDPLGGEGIGNALYSGQLAASHILKCFKSNDFSASFNQAYDKQIEKAILGDFGFRHWLIGFMKRHPKLFNYSVKKVSTNMAFRKMLANALASGEIKKEMLSYRFFKNLLVK
jgi:geranylgeranyl reductase family protein